MNLAVNVAEFARPDLERFRAAIVAHVGLQFDDNRLGFLHEVLHRRLDRQACSAASYLRRLEDDPGRRELDALAQELTVGETYFFRHNDQFRALAEVVLPERMRARDALRSLNLLSAGCSSGEEAYSLAIVAREMIADPTWKVSIRAIDLNPAALAKAALGRYSEWALREAPADVRARWFCHEGRELVLDETLRAGVEFTAGNLAGDDPALWQPAGYDVIFCRNALMYFAPQQMRAAIARFSARLAPGGYLFLGHAETLRGISDDFHICHTHNTFYYRRKARGERTGARPEPAVPLDLAPARAAASLDRAAADTWFDSIRAANERVTALVTLGAEARKPAPASAWRLAPVFDLLRRERFVDALDYVRGGPPEAENDADVLLVKAVLLAQGGQLPAAQEACRRLLLIDELNAGAHYVLALCHDTHEPARAMEHFRLAAHLDPAFAMPRLHCGLLARRAGDRDRARRELAQALFLLKREDVSRLLLFGGGFTRDALLELCHAAIADCGEES